MAKEAEEKEEGENSKKSSTMKIVIVSIVAALIVGGGLVGGTFYFVSNMNSANADISQQAKNEGEEEEKAKPKEPAQYHAMQPKFVVSFRDQSRARFMQFEIEIMTRKKDVISRITEHDPAIRSSLLMLFDNQSYEKMSSQQGKKQLLVDVVKEINSTLKKVTGDNEMASVVEASYFTSFVIQ